MARKLDGGSIRSSLETAAVSLGFACVLRMVLLSYRLVRSGTPSPDTNLVVHALFLGALLASLCALIGLREKTDSLFLRSRWAAAVVMAVTAALYWVVNLLLPLLFEAAVFAAVLLLFAYALGLAACLCAWGCILFQSELLNGLVAVALVPVLLSLFPLVSRIANVPSSAVTGMVAILMVPCFLSVRTSTTVPVVVTGWKALRSLPRSTIAVFLCGVYACSIASGVLALDNFERASTGDMAVVFVVSLAVSGSLGASIMAKSFHHRFETTVQVVSTLLVIGVLFTAIAYSLTGSESRLPSNLLAVARRFCLAGCLMGITQAMHKHMFSPTMLFGLFGIAGLLVLQLLQGPVTPAVNAAVDDALSQNQELVILMVSGVLIFVAFVMMVPLRGPVDMAQDVVEKQKRDLRDAYDTVAQGYGLTAREREVMQLIAEGNSMRGVGEQLFISLGTVQSHSKKIYKKLDIHSRQELLDLIHRHMP